LQENIAQVRLGEYLTHVCNSSSDDDLIKKAASGNDLPPEILPRKILRHLSNVNVYVLK
jgi:hypothetical protein